MGYLSLMAITAMCKDPDVTCMDRLAMLVTLLLAACTYSLVVGSSLPTLGYLTLLDRLVGTQAKCHEDGRRGWGGGLCACPCPSIHATDQRPVPCLGGTCWRCSPTSVS